MGFKIGDKVRVKSWEEIEKTLNDYRECRGVYFNATMECLCGKIIELSASDPYYARAFRSDENRWLWVEEWLESVESAEKKEKESVKMEKVVVVRGMNEQQVRKYLGNIAESIETAEMPRTVAAICRDIENKPPFVNYHSHGNTTIAVCDFGCHVGIARCHPNDEWDSNIARALSKARAFGWKGLEKELLAAL